MEAPTTVKKAADGDGQAAHGFFNLAELTRTGGAHGVRTGAAGHADGDRVLDAEQLEDGGRRDVAEETRHDDGRDG